MTTSIEVDMIVELQTENDRLQERLASEQRRSKTLSTGLIVLGALMVIVSAAVALSIITILD